MINKWMNDIHKRLAGRKRKAPVGLLDDIKQEMNRRGLVTPIRSVQFTPVVSLWTKRIAVAAAVMLLAGSGWMAYQLLSTDENRLATKTEKAVVPLRSNGNENIDATKQTSDVDGNNGQMDQNYFSGLSKQRSNGSTGPISRVKQLLASIDEHASEAQTALVEDDRKNDATEESSVSGHSENIQEQSQNANTDVPKQYSAPSDSHQQMFNHDDSKVLLANYDKKNRSSFTAGIQYSGSAPLSVNGQQAIVLATADPIGYYDQSLCGWTAKGYLDHNANFSTSTSYQQPMKVGLSLGYRINERWSLRSGVDYSYLKSETIETAGVIQSITHQQLHYIGIPLSASYTLWRDRHVHAYLSGGGEIEKLVKGRAESSDNYQLTPVSDVIKESSPQFSINLSVGAEYELLPRVSIFAEPGGSYYFDNHSNVENIYKDKKLNFNLNVGFRVNVGP